VFDHTRTPYGLLMNPGHPHEPQSARPPAAPERKDREESAGILARASRRVGRLRSWVHAQPGGAQAWRVAVALSGLVVILVGIAFLIVPGPGWLTIFAGLGIWATEFVWAKSLLTWVRKTVVAWTAWLKRQPRWLTVLVGSAGLAVIAAIVVGVWLH
jgi:uncharacterized protein (TIGR02611 family)